MTKADTANAPPRLPPAPLARMRRRSTSDGSDKSDEDSLWENASKFRGFAPEGGIATCALGTSSSSSDAVASGTTIGPPNGIARLVADARRCLFDLTGSESGIAPSSAIADRAVEKAAILIHESMGAPTRTFHDVTHVFDLLDFEGVDSIQTLAGFFHDAIYYTVDGRLSDMQAEVLEGVIVEEGEGKTVRLSGTICEEDRQISMVVRCFGFEPGQTLNPFLGLNEILSAAVAARILRDVLGDVHLLQIAACIEATIPFRKPDANGKSCSQSLYERLGRINAERGLDMTDDQIVCATRRALTLANMDVSNFSATEHGQFLSNTWKLLPENNITLRTDGASYISHFAFALQKMLGFLQNLDPTSIYASFRNVPSARELKYLTDKARENLNVATRYLQLKLLGISVVAALAELTGGDAPLIMFVRGMHVDVSGGGGRGGGVELESSFRRGSLPAVSEEGIHSDAEGGGGVETLSIADATNQRRVSVIPILGVVPKSVSEADRNEKVYGLLKFGRTSASEFDIVNSPLAAYLYGQMGDTGALASLEHCGCPMDEASATSLLDSIPPEAVGIIARSCSKTALTRADALLAIAKTYCRRARQTFP